ncbi:MAG: HEPN domain-containing protein [Candidatus Kuenenbacteria bacterium]
MIQKDIKNIVKYWIKTAERDFETMNGLFKIKRYPESLFFGHIVLEKILKALVVQEIKKQAPYSHDLIGLSELAKINLVEENKDLLDLVNTFNIRCRYPDYKLKFYKKYNNLKYAKEKLNLIQKLYKKLCQLLKNKIK